MHSSDQILGANVNPSLDFLVRILEHIEFVLFDQILVGNEHGQNAYVHALPGKEGERAHNSEKG